MATGIVKWFNPDKRFGFIVPDQGGPDAFVHASELEASGLSSVHEGDKVQYELGANKGKSCATQIKKLK